MRAALLAAVVFGTVSAGEPYHLIGGSVPLERGPDGNTVVLEAPDGLIVVDTGRHPQHVQAILDYAKQRRRPIAAIVNSHWHLDHTTGNWDIRQAYPHVDVYASNALDGALVGFLNRNRAQGGNVLADPKTSAAQKAEILRGRAVIDHPERIRPNHVITKSGRMKVAGRTLEVRMARFAATEGDVWLYDPKTRVAIVGDLVVGLVPFMDTACPDGWSEALDEIEATPFVTLVPGHGEPMDRADFLAWRKAYNNFLACGRSKADKAQCVGGWEREAARFIDAEHRDYVREAAGYYLDTRLRSSPEEQQRYCRPLKAS